MSKPSEIPRWAATAAGALASNVTAPSSGQMDTGWTTGGALAVSSYDNRFKAFTHLWLKYLDSLFTSDGRLIQQTHTLQIGPTQFVSISGTVTYGLGSITGTGFNIGAGIPLPFGKRVTAVRAMILDNSTGPTKLRADIYTTDNAGNSTLIASSPVSAGTFTNQTLTISGLTSTIATAAHLSVSIITTTGSAVCTLHMCEVDYDELI